MEIECSRFEKKKKPAVFFSFTSRETIININRKDKMTHYGI